MALTDNGGLVPTMPVMPADSNRGFGGFGGDGAWWIIILFLFVFCGWGNNGWGGNGNNGAGVVDGYVLTSDFANIERKLDGVNNGICDGFYAMNTGMLNGFAGVTQAVTSGFSQAELARCNQQAALMQQLNAMQMQAQECCCENCSARPEMPPASDSDSRYDKTGELQQGSQRERKERKKPSFLLEGTDRRR